MFPPVFVILLLGVLSGDGRLLNLWGGTRNDRCSRSAEMYFGCAVSESPLGVYRQAAVATDAPDCADMGRDILRERGSAVDAAISVLLCMGLTIPESMGLGGGSLIVHYNRATGESLAIDAREEAPSQANATMFKGKPLLARNGALSIAIPGEVAGYWEAHQRFGKLPWEQLFEGPIKLARNGFKVGFHFANALKQQEEAIKVSNMKDLFMNPTTGQLYKRGEVLKRPDLAATFEKLANSTADIMYSGEIGQKMVEEIREAGGIITLEDMKQYKVRISDALKMDLNYGLSLLSVRPPGSGAVLGFILNVMLGYTDLYPSARSDPKKAALFYHRLVETFKYAYSRRMIMGDERFDDVQEVLRNLTSRFYANQIRNKIDDRQTYEPGHYTSGQVTLKEDHGTAHVSVVDGQGNAVSIGTTINLYFGSKFVSKSTGIILNDEMDDFSSPGITNAFGVPPSNFNLIAPKKRPLSSMCPAIILNTATGEPLLVFGGAGGTQITTGTALVFLRNLMFGESVKSAIDAPRLHHQLYPNVVVHEDAFPPSILEELRKLGHEVRPIVGRGAVMTAVGRGRGRSKAWRWGDKAWKGYSSGHNLVASRGLLYANTDYRKGGSVSGL